MSRLYSTHDASKFLRVNPFTIAKWIDLGHLKAWKTAGGHRRIEAEELRRYLVDHEMPVPEELGGSTRKRRLLIVDDEQPILNSLKRMFRPFAGELEVSLTISGVEALLLLAEFRPDAMLIDVRMPGIDGLEVCRRVPKRESLGGVKLLVMSADHSIETCIAAVKAGALACLHKPFKAEEVLAWVREETPTGTTRERHGPR